MTLRIWLLIALATLASLTPARGQFNQYTAPGTFTSEAASNYERVDKAMEDSLWRFGKLAVDPWLTLRNLSLVDQSFDNGGGPDPDLTVTAGAGLRAYLPVGGKLLLAGHLQPEYVWWRDATQRNRLNGRFGAGLFGFFGRTALELSARRDDSTRIFSREFEEQIDQRSDAAKLLFDFGIVGGLSTFVEGELRRHELLEDELERARPLSVLDRDQVVGRVGLRFRFSRGLRIGAGYEASTFEFEETPELRDTDGEAVLFSLEHGGDTWRLNANLAYQSLEVGTGPRPLEYDDFRGRATSVWQPTKRLILELYGNRNLVFSFSGTSPLIEDTTLGLGFRFNLSHWATVRVFGENGTNDFINFDAGLPARNDDFQAVGADLNFHYRGFRVQLGATQTDYDSNMPEFDRETTVYRSNVRFGVRGISLGTSGIRAGTGELSPWG